MTTGNNVTLLDGKVVDTASREYQIECLARFIADIPTIGKRREFIAAYEKRFTRVQMDSLLNTIKLIFEERRKQNE